MKNKLDLKSIIIGVLATLLLMSLLGAKQENEEWGDISARSLTIREGGSIRILSMANKNLVDISGEGAGGGHIDLNNSLGGRSVNLGANFEGQGGFITFNQDGKVSSHLGTGKKGEGFPSPF